MFSRVFLGINMSHLLVLMVRWCWTSKGLKFWNTEAVFRVRGIFGRIGSPWYAPWLAYWIFFGLFYGCCMLLLERTVGCNWYTGDVFWNLLHLMFGLSNFVYAQTGSTGRSSVLPCRVFGHPQKSTHSGPQGNNKNSFTTCSTSTGSFLQVSPDTVLGTHKCTLPKVSVEDDMIFLFPEVGSC